MRELVGALLIAAAGGATTAALLTLTVILLPNLSGMSARVMESMPGRSFALGTVNFIFFFAVAAVLSRIAEGLGRFLGGLFSLAALSVALVLLSLLAIGLAGLVRLISERTSDSKPMAAGRLLGAAVLLVGAGLAPLAGWFVLTPLALFTGLGATIIALVQWVGGRSSSRSLEENQPRINTN